MTITLSETKIYLRVEYNDVESLIRSLIDSAIDICTDASGNKSGGIYSGDRPKDSFLIHVVEPGSQFKRSETVETDYFISLSFC